MFFKICKKKLSTFQMKLCYRVSPTFKVPIKIVKYLDLNCPFKITKYFIQFGKSNYTEYENSHFFVIFINFESKMWLL